MDKARTQTLIKQGIFILTTLDHPIVVDCLQVDLEQQSKL